MSQIVINGNNIDLLKSFPDNYFDSVVTDPPYGLGQEPDAAKLMKDWVEQGYHEIEGKGFMGKEWDAFVPQPIFWKEVFRVLKHGGHAVAFYGTRTYDWGVMAMRFAGFEIRDCIQWIYGSGFPKSHNISKAIDKMQGAEREIIGKSNYSMPKADNSMSENSYGISGGKLANGNTAERIFANITKPNTDEAKEWDGWGSALKPANEPIVLARKPLEKGLSIAENVLKWGVGGINIDGCRVKKIDGDRTEYGVNGIVRKTDNNVYGKQSGVIEFDGTNGRFPANIILTHHPECECKGWKKVKGSLCTKPSDCNVGTGATQESFKNIQGNRPPRGFGDENNQETVEDWNCHPDCPIKIMDEQSGILNKQGISKTDNKSGWQNQYVGGDEVKPIERKLYLDVGGASRFFYCAKASKSERNKGLEGFEEKPLAFSNQAKAELKRGNTNYDGGDSKGHGNKIRQLKNFHPTVKPVKLMQYLVRLITPPNGKVLDPFCGSGTTGVACKLEGFEFVGMEQDPEYTKIAEARILNYTEEKEIIFKQELVEEEEAPKELIQAKLF